MKEIQFLTWKVSKLLLQQTACLNLAFKVLVM